MHTHRPSRSRDAIRASLHPYPFTGPLRAPADLRAEPRAHGGCRYEQRCSCGATRQLNASAGWVEYGPWLDTRDATE